MTHATALYLIKFHNSGVITTTLGLAFVRMRNAENAYQGASLIGIELGSCPLTFKHDDLRRQKHSRFLPGARARRPTGEVTLPIAGRLPEARERSKRDEKQR